MKRTLYWGLAILILLLITGRCFPADTAEHRHKTERCF